MAKNKEIIDTTEAKLMTRISAFATKNKKLIFIGLAALVVVLIAVVVITSSVNSSTEKKYVRVAGYEDALTDIIDSEDSSAVAEFLTNVEAEIKGSSYPSVKAAFILGEYYAAKSDWAKAYDYYTKAYNLNSKIYLASVAEFNAAAAIEEQGDTDKALTHYSHVSESKESPLASKALFNVARIYFQKGNLELAKATFQQLIDTYAASEYSKLAKNFLSTH